MKTPVLYPYPTLADGDAELTVTALRLDGKSRPDWLHREESTVALFEHAAKWQRAELDLAVTFPESEVIAFESEHGPVAVVAVAHCLPTNGREQTRLARTGTDAGRWLGTLEVDRDNYRGRVKLEAVLTATVGGVSFRPVAVTNAWSVHFDEPETFHLGKCLPVKWLDFKKVAPEGSIARTFPDSTHVVNFDGPLPVLLLNSAFDGLEGLLKDRKDRRGAEKALHDILRTGIARSVWLALLRDSLAEVRQRDDEDSVATDWPDTPWRAEVLKHILPEVAPDKTDAELLEMVRQEWSEAGTAGDLFARAEAVIGDIVKANEVVRRFVKNNTEEVIG